MPARKAPKAPKPPKPWARESPGRYRSSDGRFTIDQEGTGRWFVVDEEQHDELGLARTLGPYDTLDEAKARADELRAAPPEESPLRERIADAARRSEPARTVVLGGRRRPSATAAAPSSKDVDPSRTPPPPAVPKPTWLDRLAPADARRARGLVEALTALGFAKAEQIVRREVEGGVPAVATSVLARALARAVRDAPSGTAVERAAARLRRGGADASDLDAFAAAVRNETLERVLSIVSARERDPDAAARLPGWRLVEADAEREGPARRLILSADEVERARDDGVER